MVIWFYLSAEILNWLLNVCMHLNCHTSEHNMGKEDDSAAGTSETGGNDANTTKCTVVMREKNRNATLLE